MGSLTSRANITLRHNFLAHFALQQAKLCSSKINHILDNVVTIDVVDALGRNRTRPQLRHELLRNYTARSHDDVMHRKAARSQHEPHVTLSYGWNHDRAVVQLRIDISRFDQRIQ